MNKKSGIIFIFLFILSVFVTGCGGGGSSAAPSSTNVNNIQYGGISGVITDPADGKPVSGAIVTLDNGVVSAPVAMISNIKRSINRSPVAATITNANGYYQFASVPTGNYNISVVKDGKLGAQISHVVRAGEETTVTIELTPVITVSGTFTVATSSITNSNSPDALVWLLGTSFGSVAIQTASDSSTTTFSFKLTGIPANPTVPYTLKYFSEGSVSQSRTVLLVPTQLEVTLSSVALVPDATSSITNNNPVATVSSSASTVTVNTAVILNGAGSTDPDNDTLTYHWTQTSGPTIAGTQSGSTYTFTPTLAGNYTYLLIVKDDRGGVSLPASIYVNAYTVANLPPTATANASVDGGTQASSVSATVSQTISLIGTGTDPENASMTYRWVQTGGPAVVFSDQSTGESLNAQISFSPSEAGNYAFAFVVSDGVFKTSPEFVTVNVTAPAPPVNNVPVANAGTDQSIADINTPVTLGGSWAPQDAMDVPVITWTQITGPSVTLNNPATLTPDFTPTLPGNYTFQLIVNDGVHTSLPDFVSIVVNTPGNQAPVVVANVTDGSSPLSVVAPSTTVILDGTGSSDPDSQPLNPTEIKWTQISGPPVTINNDTFLTANTGLTAVGTYSFKLELYDGLIKSAAMAFITVNQKPVGVLALPDQQAVINTVVTIDGTGSYDNDGVPVSSYTLVQKSGPYSVTVNEGTPGIFTFQPNRYGNYVFGFVANDALESSDEIITTIVVKAPPFDRTKATVNMNNPGTQDNLTGTAGAAGSTITLKASSDRDFNNIIGTNVSNADGSFILDIGDNLPSINDDKFYISFFDSNNVRGGDIFEFINDVTPPASPIINFDTTDGHINSANETAYTISGKAEPGIDLTAVVGTANNTMTVPANGDFTINVNCAALVDGAGIKVELIVTDAYNNTHTYFIKEVMKDTNSPVVALQSPLGGDRVKASPDIIYTLTENAKEVEFRFVNTVTSAIHSFILKTGKGLLAGENKITGVPLNPSPLIGGEQYNLTITAIDGTGNISNTAATSNLTCDTGVLPGTSVTYPVANADISSEKPLLSYVLSEAMGKGQIIIDSPDDPACPRVIDIPTLTSGTHTNEAIGIKTPLKLGITYSYIIVFEDTAGNAISPVFIGNLTPVDQTDKIRIIKPADNGVMSANPVFSYVLTDAMTAVSFNFNYVSGPASPSESYALSGVQLGAGVHENEVFNPSGSFVDGAVYELEITGTTSEGKAFTMDKVIQVTVDATSPTLNTAVAVQSEFGKWHGGDQIIFSFSEPMDTGIFGGLADLAQINTNMDDSLTAAVNDFSPSTPVWSNDSRTLTLTLLDTLSAVTKFKAGRPGDPGIAGFDPGNNVRDKAGNVDATGAPVELISKGDVTAPVIRITSPIDSFKIATDPVVLYNVTEDLREGTLAIFLVEGLDTTPVRLFTIDPPRLVAGDHSIYTFDEGIKSLTSGSIFRIEVSGIDGAGNQAMDKADQLLVDGTVPTPPAMNQYSFRNFSHNVKYNGGAPDGMTGYYFRLYINGTPYTASYQAPYNLGAIVLSGIPIANPGDTVEYSFVTQAGEESGIVNAGVVPALPSIADATNLAIGLGGSAGFFTGNSAGNLDQINTNYYAVFSNNMNNEIMIGTTDGSGVYSPMVDGILVSDIEALATVYYVVNNVDGHFSAARADGRFETLAIAGPNDATNGITPGILETGDTIRLTFTGNVDISAGINDSNISIGSCAVSPVGTYTWAGVLSDFNIAPVSAGDIANLAQSFPITATSGVAQTEITFTIGIGGNFFNAVTQPTSIRVEINPYGTSLITGTTGGHCVLGTEMISPGSSDNGGVPVTGF